MRSNSFGQTLTLTTFGESHGPAIGAVLDGVPAGLALENEHIASALHRRRPGQSVISSPRQEKDDPEILSGVFEGKTLGTPIAVIVRNKDARPADYNTELRRIGHADTMWEKKYGFRDYRGGGRASGRETVARVIGGAIAERLLPRETHIVACVTQIGDIAARVLPQELTRQHVDAFTTRCPDAEADERMMEQLVHAAERGDSLGGIVELRIDGAPTGLGGPVFRKTEALLTSAMMSIGAVSGVTLGTAFTDISLPGSDFHIQRDGFPAGTDTRSHGIQGGITNGDRIVLRLAVKPPSSTGETARRGRHDPVIAPRLVPVAEAMAALVLADLLLSSRLDRLD